MTNRVRYYPEERAEMEDMIHFFFNECKTTKDKGLVKAIPQAINAYIELLKLNRTYD